MAARDLLGHGPDHGPSPFLTQLLFREARGCLPATPLEILCVRSIGQSLPSSKVATTARDVWPAFGTSCVALRTARPATTARTATAARMPAASSATLLSPSPATS